MASNGVLYKFLGGGWNLQRLKCVEVPCRWRQLRYIKLSELSLLEDVSEYTTMYQNLFFPAEKLLRRRLSPLVILGHCSQERVFQHKFVSFQVVHSCPVRDDLSGLSQQFCPVPPRPVAYGEVVRNDNLVRKFRPYDGPLWSP